MIATVRKVSPEAPRQRNCLKGEALLALWLLSSPVKNSLLVLRPLLAEDNELLPVITWPLAEHLDQAIVDLLVLLERQLRFLARRHCCLLLNAGLLLLLLFLLGGVSSRLLACEWRNQRCLL